MRRRSSFRSIGFFLILAILFLSIRSPLLAQGTTVVLHDVNLDSFPTTNVIVSAWNGSQPIRDLAAENFTLVEDAQIVPIQEVMSLDRSQVPVSLILVLDTSTSMQANNAIDDAKVAANSILDRLKPNDRVALLAFGGQIDLNVDLLDPTRELAFTTDKEQVRALIAGLQANGSTPLYDAIVKGIRLSANEAMGSRAMILLSDGRDEAIGDDGQLLPASVLTADDAINEARQGSLPIFTIGLGESIDQPFLVRLGDQSGGTFAETPTSDQLNLLFNEALDRLLQRYVIRYQSNALSDGTTHALQVQLNYNEQSSSGQTPFISPLIVAPSPVPAEGEQVPSTPASGDGANPAEETNSGEEANSASGEQVPSTPASGDGANPAEETNSGEEANPAEESNSGDGANSAEEANNNASPEENENSSLRATVVDFLSANWLPLSLLAIAALLLSGVLFIWRQDRKRSSYNGGNHPLPPPPIPEPFVSSAPQPNQAFSQEPFVPTPTHADTNADAYPDANTDLYNQNTDLNNSQSSHATSATGLTHDGDIEPTIFLKASLTVIEGIDKGNRFDILEEKMTIGRGGRGIEVQIALSDRTVSREQAVIKIENQEYFLYNLSKSNLTRLNGQEMKGRMRLRDGDQIEMGKTTLQFIDP